MLYIQIIKQKSAQELNPSKVIPSVVQACEVVEQLKLFASLQQFSIKIRLFNLIQSAIFMNYILQPFIICLISCSALTHNFIISITKNQQKCFYTAVSHLNMLDIRFGFPKPTYQNCLIQVAVDYVRMDENYNQNEEEYNTLYKKNWYCHDRNPRDYIVLKYSDQSQNVGKYRICAANIDDFGSNKTLFELIISEKEMLNNSTSNIIGELIQSRELNSLLDIFTVIKRKISWSYLHLKQVDERGQVLDLLIRQKEQLMKMLSWIQIIFLLFYGLLWIWLVRLVIMGNNLKTV